MSEDNYNDKTQVTGVRGSGDQEIPRRGYETRPDSTVPSGQQAVPPPPIYDGPPARYGPRPGSPQPPRRGQSKERLPRDSGLYLPWWSLLVLIGFVGAATVGVLIIVLNLGANDSLSLTPQFVVVTGQFQPAVGSNQANNPGQTTAIPSLQPSAAPVIPTFQVTKTPLPGGCLLNSEVVVFGTGAVGLNLRQEPRLASDVQFVAREGDKLMVLDGPQFIDDYEWCKVENLTRPGQFGWGVLEFMIAADAVEGGQ